MKDEYLAGMTRPPYLHDVNETFDQSISISLSQENKNTANCKYWIGSGSDCSSIVPFGVNLPNLNNTIDQCEFRSFFGPLGTLKWTFITMNKLVTFEGAIVQIILYGIGTDQLPFHIQSAVRIFSL